MALAPIAEGPRRSSGEVLGVLGDEAGPADAEHFLEMLQHALRPMAQWIKTNFARITDRSPDDTMEWRLSRGAIRSQQVGVSRFTFRPGARMPYGHRHREQEEVYVIVSGSGRLKLDNEIVELEEWDIVRVPPEVMRAFEGGPDGLEVLCIGGRRPKGGDTERDEAFWT